MNQVRSESPGTIPGFWQRLAFALEPLGGSGQELLERRVRQLEADVMRLTALHEKRSKT